jgi:hypothetical protein
MTKKGYTFTQLKMLDYTKLVFYLTTDLFFLIKKNAIIKNLLYF